MKYVALRRGINVGGKNKVDMKQLKLVFEQAGMTSVRTYINSGNILFEHAESSKTVLADRLEQAIESTFGFAVKVLVRSQADINSILNKLPGAWVNDAVMKCDVMFLWDKVATEDILHQLTIKSDIDSVKYVAGTILWSVDKKNVTRSGMMKLVGTDLYKHMTIRNCNTLRKIASMMNE